MTKYDDFDLDLQNSKVGGVTPDYKSAGKFCFVTINICPYVSELVCDPIINPKTDRCPSDTYCPSNGCDFVTSINQKK